VKRLPLVALAIVVAAVAFTYRFNALGGTLGGFDNDEFIHLMRSDMILHGEQPLRDFSDAELRGAWPSLSYAVPAWAQQILGRNLLSEAYLTIGALAIAYGITFLLAADLSNRWWVGLLAAIVAVATTPKLYNYPKVLMLALGALAIRAVTITPSWGRLGCGAAITAIAVLFRHDYGVYVAVGIVAGLIASNADDWKTVARAVARYAGMTAALLLPSAVWVQMYRGIPAYLNDSLASTGLETSRTQLRLAGGLLSATYYALWAVVASAAVVLAARMLAGGARLTSTERGTAAGLLLMAAIANVFFLRANLSQRFGDAIVPVVLLAAWAMGAASGLSGRALRAAATVVPIALLLGIFASAYVFADVPRDLDTSGLSDSWEKTTQRFRAARDELRALPPDIWSANLAEGSLRAARYVAECTSPDDNLLVGGYAPEIPVFARRRFAAGQATMSLSFYTSDADQERALARVRQQSVPIVLVPVRGSDDDFSEDYPLIARYVAEHYRDAGIIPVDGERRIRVFVEAARQPVRMDAHLGLPCFR